MADRDSFPDIQTPLTIACISPIGSIDAERAASAIRRLKTPYWILNLNLIQVQKLTEIDASKVAQIFVDLNRRRLFMPNSSLYDANNDLSICVPS